MSQPSSQDSIGTQEICSQGSFEEIWQTLGRTFSNPEKVIQGVLTEEIPTIIEYKEERVPDNLEIIYEHRSVRNVGQSQSQSQPLSDFDLVPTNGHSGHMINGNSHLTCTSPLIPSAHVDAVQLPPILPNTHYPGNYKFSIDFEPNNEPITKATPWVYQAEHHKLFVKMQCVCPILFKTLGNPPPGSAVRAILTYKRPEHYKDIVTRCPNHRNMCKDGHPYHDHVMRCENSATRYEVCPSTGRLSLVIPLRATNVVVGDGYFKELFKFTCFNSCVGGMNRRPTNLLFRLECGGKVYGRAIVEVRVCASPGRDYIDKDSVGGQKGATKDTEKRVTEGAVPTTAFVPTSHLASDVPKALPSQTVGADSSTSRTSPTSPTTVSSSCYPRASVLMSTRKDVSCTVQEPFQFPNVQINQVNPRKRPCTATNGYVFSRAKRSCPSDMDDDEVYTLTIRGSERYAMLLKIKEGLDMLDGIRRPTDSSPPKYAHTDESRSIPEFTKMKPYMPSPAHVKKEENLREQCTYNGPSSQGSQENSPPSSQLSRTSSNASSVGNGEEYSAWQVTLKRTLNLEQLSQHKPMNLHDKLSQQNRSCLRPNSQ